MIDVKSAVDGGTAGGFGVVKRPREWARYTRF